MPFLPLSEDFRARSSHKIPPSAQRDEGDTPNLLRAANPNLPLQQPLERRPKVCGGRAEPPRVSSLAEETGAAPSCPSHLCPPGSGGGCAGAPAGAAALPRNNSQTG